jgi:hypothetical protein
MAVLDWWVPREELGDETEQWSVRANHSVSAWRAVGGRLVATDERLVFYPNRVDRKLAGRVWSVPFKSVTSVGKKPPTGGLFNGGLRSRLRLVTDDGVEHLFVVNGLGRIIEQTDALLRRSNA